MKYLIVLAAAAIGFPAYGTAAEEGTVLDIFPKENIAVETFLSQPTEALYVRPSGTSDWGADLITAEGSDEYDAAVYSYDLRLTGEDGSQKIYLGIPLAGASDIRLYEEGDFAYSVYQGETGAEITTIPVRAYEPPVLMKVRRNLNVREGSSTSAAQVGTLNQNQEVLVLGETSNTDRQWLAVFFDGRVRYCVGANMDQIAGQPAPAFPAPAAAAEDHASGEAAQDEASGETDQEEAAQTSGRTFSISEGMALGVTGPAAGSAAEQDSEKSADAAKASESEQKLAEGEEPEGLQKFEAPVHMKASEAVKVRSGPGADYEALGTIPGDEEIDAYGVVVTDREWTQVMYKDTLRYCASQYLIPAEGTAASTEEEGVTETESPEGTEGETEAPDGADGEGEAETEAPDGADGEGEAETEGTREAQEEELTTQAPSEPTTEASAEETTESSAAAQTEGSSEARTESSSAEESEDSSEAEAEGSSEAESEDSSEAEAEGSSEAETEGPSEAQTEGSSAAQTEGASASVTEASPAVTTEASAEETTETVTEAPAQTTTEEATTHSPEAAGPNWHTIERVETVQSVRRPGHGYKFILYSNGIVEVQVF